MMRATIFAAALAAGFFTATSTINNAMHKVEDLCTTADYLNALAKATERKLKNQIANAQADFLEAARLRVTIAAQATNSKFETTLLQIKLTAATKTSLNKAAAQYDAVVSGIGAVKELTGTQELLAELQKLNFPNIDSAEANTFLGETGKHLVAALSQTATGECTTDQGIRKAKEQLKTPARQRNRLPIFTIKPRPAGTRLTDDLTIFETMGTKAIPSETCQRVAEGTNIGFRSGTLLTTTPKALAREAGSSSDYDT
uniref:Variant surface glycoprotein 1125.1618 n=1 Tax=Trypanosoma brucei TaxID=5691 RepID=A0A1J0R7K1_9TRYP|nr:variant surface glycoprotein 1125.1618 [Trypanosoma brucei]